MYMVGPIQRAEPVIPKLNLAFIVKVTITSFLDVYIDTSKTVTHVIAESSINESVDLLFPHKHEENQIKYSINFLK